MNPKRWTLLLAAAFTLGFGAVMASRLDASTISTALGVVCALAFGVPVTVVVTAGFIHYRTRERDHQRQVQHRYPQQQPPVVIVPPTQAPQLPYQSLAAPFLDGLGSTPQRRFEVIGEDFEDEYPNAR